MIEFKNISKIYGPKEQAALRLMDQGASQDEVLKATGCTVALRDIHLRIEKGDLFCILGASGSGKSTLLRHINRLIEPTRGEVWCDTVNVTQLSRKALNDFRQHRVAMVFQHFGLLPHLKAVENVEYGLRVMGVPKKERREKALHFLDEVGLSGYENAYPEAFSGGMKQRVGLARALAVDSEVLLMDEPFSALDPLTRLKLQDLLLTLQQKLHKTILFITHDIQEAKRIANRMAILNQGELMQVGRFQELADQPANDYVQAFMAMLK